MPCSRGLLGLLRTYAFTGTVLGLHGLPFLGDISSSVGKSGSLATGEGQILSSRRPSSLGHVLFTHYRIKNQIDDYYCWALTYIIPFYFLGGEISDVAV